MYLAFYVVNNSCIWWYIFDNSRNWDNWDNWYI